MSRVRWLTFLYVLLGISTIIFTAYDALKTVNCEIPGENTEVYADKVSSVDFWDVSFVNPETEEIIWHARLDDYQKQVLFKTKKYFPEKNCFLPNNWWKLLLFFITVIFFAITILSALAGIIPCYTNKTYPLINRLEAYRDCKECMWKNVCCFNDKLILYNPDLSPLKNNFKSFFGYETSDSI